MKIVYCIPQLYRAGGMERIVSSKVNWLARKGHELHVITTDGKGNPPYFPLHESVRIHDLGLNYIDDAGLDPFRWRFQRNFKLYRHKRMLGSLLRQIRPDVSVSTFEQEAHILYKLPYAGRRILEYHFVRNLRQIEKRSGIRSYVDRYLDFKDGRVTGKYDAFVVLTERDREMWPCQENIHVIPNFIVSRPECHSDLSSKRVIAAGRLERVKGFDRLIDIWKVADRSFPDWKLEIYGEGSMRDELESRIKDNGLEGKVSLCRPVADIFQPMRDSSIYAMTSLYEGFSMVIAEAFSMGLPVVAFDVDCGPASLVSDGRNGFLVKDGDIRAYSERLMQLMESAELRSRLGEGALESSASFERDKVMKRWLDLMSSAPRSYKNRD